MKSRFLRFGVLIASVMGLLVTSTPAEASWVKNVTLNGLALLTNCKNAVTGAPSPGLSYPVWTSGTTTTTEVPVTKTEIKNDPKGGTEVNTIVLNGNLCNFSFNAGCIKKSVSVGKKAPGVAPCLIMATGTVTGFCGLASGTGKAVLTDTSVGKAVILTDFKFSLTVITLRVSGGGAETNIRGKVTVNPNTAAGGSCTNKTATTFTIAGDVVIKDCTPGHPMPPECPIDG